MGWRDSDAVAQTMTGEGDDSSGSGVASGWDGGIVNALARLGRRSPYARAITAKKIKPSSKAPTPADPDLVSSIGAGDAGSGPNGSGRSNPLKPAAESSDTPTSGSQGEFGPLSPPDASGISPGMGSAKTAQDIGSAPPDSMPQLAPQGGSNRLIRALARLSGLAGPTPDPGQPHVGPGTGFTVDSDSGQIRKQTYAERTAHMANKLKIKPFLHRHKERIIAYAKIGVFCHFITSLNGVTVRNSNRQQHHFRDMLFSPVFRYSGSRWTTSGWRGATMKLFTCNPIAFVQSLTKSQRKALADVLQLPASKDGKERPAGSLRAALERTK